MNARNGAADLDPLSGAGVDEVRKPLNEARHLPGYFYTSQEMYEVEKERIFLSDWLPIGRVEEIEKPGDYKTFRIVDEPFIVARDKSGKLSAFMNRCAHRGVAVAKEAGNAKEFMCPYHGWLYDLEGKLIGAPAMDQAVGWDKKTCRLKPVTLREWAGWIFVTFNENPVPWEEWIGPYDKEFGFLRQENCRLADKIEVEVDCNWKFPLENLMDNYHSAVLHVKTIGPTLSVGRYTGVRTGSPAFTAYYDARPMTADGQTRFGKMPWMTDKAESFACSAHIAPNMHMLARSDNVHPFIFYPIGVNRCRITCYMLWPAEWHTLPDFRERVAPYNAFTRAVIDEDLSVMESQHDAATSKRYEPGRMSRLELGVYNLLNYDVDRALGIGDTKLYEK
jgi:phenylpropionate dioxygenase-like ring-hydroxylating dioxygenase large terminal subunit